MIKLSEANATLVPPIAIHKQATIPIGPQAKPTKCVDLALTLHVDTSEHMREVDKLFPASDVQAKTIAGREECKGEVRKTNTRLADMFVCVRYGKQTVIEAACEIKSAPQLHISEDGNAKLVLRQRIQVPVSEVGGLLELLGADVRVTIEPAQMDLSDQTTLAEEAPKQKKEKALRAVGSDPL